MGAEIVAAGATKGTVGAIAAPTAVAAAGSVTEAAAAAGGVVQAAAADVGVAAVVAAVAVYLEVQSITIRIAGKGESTWQCLMDGL